MVAERRPSFVQDCKEAGFVNACERQWHRTVAHAKAFPCGLPISLSTIRAEIVFFCSSSSSFYSFYDTVKESVRAKIFQEFRVVVKLSQGKSRQNYYGAGEFGTYFVYQCRWLHQVENQVLRLQKELLNKVQQQEEQELIIKAVKQNQQTAAAPSPQLQPNSSSVSLQSLNDTMRQQRMAPLIKL